MTKPSMSLRFSPAFSIALSEASVTRSMTGRTAPRVKAVSPRPTMQDLSLRLMVSSAGKSGGCRSGREAAVAPIQPVIVFHVIGHEPGRAGITHEGRERALAKDRGAARIAD